VVEGHDALVHVEDLPLVRVELRPARRRRLQRLAKGFGETPARRCERETAARGDGGRRGRRNVLAQRGIERRRIRAAADGGGERHRKRKKEI
jgi:hypothetical protein